MTPPMTPREKVVFKQPCKHCQRMTTVDLTALASGSGDHAELDVVAWRVKHPRHDAHLLCFVPAATDEAEPLVTAASAEALLAENAALRAANDVLEVERIGLRSAIFGSHDYDPALRHGNFIEMARTTEDARKGALNRATEAERKLAEAERLNDRAADLMRQCTDPERFEGASTLNVYANMRAWLSDLSKEAERG